MTTELGDRVVLVVDDDSAVREMLEAVLRIEGFRVLEAADGREALEVYEEHRPAAIVLDVMMPHMDGLQVLEKIQEIHAGETVPPVIMVSALGTDADQWEGYRRGAAAYIAKPVEPDELVGLLKKLLN